MTVLEQLLTLQQRHDALEVALRGVCDLLTSDEHYVGVLEQLHTRALPAALEVLDAAEHGGHSLPAGPAAEVVDVTRTPSTPRAIDQQTVSGRTCATCGQIKPDTDYGTMGKGRSKSCRRCVQARNVAAARKRRARESRDDKEPV